MPAPDEDAMDEDYDSESGEEVLGGRGEAEDDEFAPPDAELSMIQMQEDIEGAIEAEEEEEGSRKAKGSSK